MMCVSYFQMSDALCLNYFLRSSSVYYDSIYYDSIYYDSIYYDRLVTSKCG